MDGITLVALPYDSGRFDERMGRGPLHLLKSGLAEHLRARQRNVDVITIQLPDGFYSDTQALVALQQRAVEALRESLARHRLPLILSGNCGPAALSATAALDLRTTGVIWFDAHADFNTPETSASGFLDGMSLAILTGRCWPALAARFNGFEPMPEANVILVSARDLDPPEAAALRQSAITHIPTGKMELFGDAVAALSARVENFYVHLDVDVLDEAEGRANSYASGGGLSANDLYAALELLERSGRIKVAAITSYDPASDHDGRIRAIVDKAAAILAGFPAAGDGGSYNTAGSR
jgi:arginase